MLFGVPRNFRHPKKPLFFRLFILTISHSAASKKKGLIKGKSIPRTEFIFWKEKEEIFGRILSPRWENQSFFLCVFSGMAFAGLQSSHLLRWWPEFSLHLPFLAQTKKHCVWPHGAHLAERKKWMRKLSNENCSSHGFALLFGIEHAYWSDILWGERKITSGSVRKNGFLIIANSLSAFLTTKSNLAIINESDLHCFLYPKGQKGMCAWQRPFARPHSSLRHCAFFKLIKSK